MSSFRERMSNYLLSAAEHEGAALFPSGLLMYDLPSLRRRTSRTSNITESNSRQSSLSQKQSSSPLIFVGYIKRSNE